MRCPHCNFHAELMRCPRCRSAFNADDAEELAHLAYLRRRLDAWRAEGLLPGESVAHAMASAEREVIALQRRLGLVTADARPAATIASAELYDPTTNRWSEAQPMLHPHGSGLTATLLRDGRVLVLGGGRTAGAELFDPGH